MSAKPTSHIIIVGAGPVGLTLAYGLARNGVAVTVIETELSVSRQLRASTFHPPTLDMLEPWGITQELIAQGRITPTWQIRLHETGEHVTFDLSVLKDDTAHPYRLQCEQAVLSDALQARLQREASVRLWRGASVVDVGQHAGGAWVEVRTSRWRPHRANRGRLCGGLRRRAQPGAQGHRLGL